LMIIHSLNLKQANKTEVLRIRSQDTTVTSNGGRSAAGGNEKQKGATKVACLPSILLGVARSKNTERAENACDTLVVVNSDFVERRTPVHGRDETQNALLLPLRLPNDWHDSGRADAE